MTDQFRAICAELADALAEWRLGGGPPEDTADADLIARARALLAQPVAEGLTDEDLEDLAEVMNVSGNPVPAMRRALELWGRPTPQPVAVSERLPGPDDCDDQGRCWVFDDQLELPSWTLIRVQGESLAPDMYWRPANALPTPEATND